ncbi:hypothetical protein [Metallibacterium sp.]|nr:hypothetical protein [Metallibacterium sp.]
MNTAQLPTRKPPMNFLRMTDLDLRGKRVLIREGEPAALARCFE